MDPEVIAWIGGIAGGVLGLAGGIFGTYCSIRNTHGPLERRFMIRLSVWTWITIFAFLSGMYVLSISTSPSYTNLGGGRCLSHVGTEEAVDPVDPGSRSPTIGAIESVAYRSTNRMPPGPRLASACIPSSLVTTSRTASARNVIGCTPQLEYQRWLHITSSRRFSS